MKKGKELSIKDIKRELTNIYFQLEGGYLPPETTKAKILALTGILKAMEMEKTDKSETVSPLKLESA